MFHERRATKEETIQILERLAPGARLVVWKERIRHETVWISALVLDELVVERPDLVRRRAADCLSTYGHVSYFRT